MTFLPVVQRELQVACRLPLTYWIRFFAASSMVLLVWWVSRFAQTSDPTHLAQTLFAAVTSCAWLYALTAGAWHTADTLSREIREGTLGLLFLTSLRGYDIVLGKLAATSLRGVYALAAIFPVLALPILFGGVTGWQFWHVVESLLMTLLLSLSIGLLCSSFTPDFRIALISTVLALGLLIAAPLACYTVWRLQPPKVAASAPLAFVATPGGTLLFLLRDRPKSPGVLKLIELAPAVQIPLSLALLLLACRKIPRSARLDPCPPSETAPLTPFAPPNSYIAGYRHIHWAARLDQNPYFWINTVVRLPLYGIRWLFVPLGAFYLATLFLSFKGPGDGLRPVLFYASVFTAFLTHSLIKIAAILVATRSIADDQHSGALELLLVSPLAPSTLVSGQKRALFWRFRLPMLLAILMNFGLASFGALSGDSSLPFFGSILVLALAGIPILLAEVRQIAVVGIRQALRTGDPQRAFSQTFLRTLAPGWAACAVLIPACTVGFSTALAFLIAFSVQLYFHFKFLRRAEIDLERGFRPLAAGLFFDTGDWELRYAFRNALEKDSR